ncbi:MAG: AbrB/MazE/SpoVT family DNA-binding domain-containing protein [Clostridiales bacterium]
MPQNNIIKKITLTGTYSSYIVIPKKFLEEMELNKGDLVELELKDSEIVIKKWNPKKKNVIE